MNKTSEGLKGKAVSIQKSSSFPGISPAGTLYSSIQSWTMYLPSPLQACLLYFH
jgi:hypothetical protein